MSDITGMTGQSSMLFVLLALLAHGEKIDVVVVRANSEIRSIWKDTHGIQFIEYTNEKSKTILIIPWTCPLYFANKVLPGEYLMQSCCSEPISQL